MFFINFPQVFTTSHKFSQLPIKQKNRNVLVSTYTPVGIFESWETHEIRSAHSNKLTMNNDPADARAKAVESSAAQANEWRLKINEALSSAWDLKYKLQRTERELAQRASSSLCTRRQNDRLRIGSRSSRKKRASKMKQKTAPTWNKSFLTRQAL